MNQVDNQYLKAVVFVYVCVITAIVGLVWLSSLIIDN